MQVVLMGVHFIKNRTLEAKKMEKEFVKETTDFKGNLALFNVEKLVVD